jgi:GNAT superfamily N-acetyltransferase
MTSPPEIVEATSRDVPRLVDIFSNEDLKTSQEESRWFVNCYMDYHHVLLAKVGGDIQGACFWRIEGERYSGLGWIENVWVEERHRKLGLGEKLLRRAVDDISAFFAE